MASRTTRTEILPTNTLSTIQKLYNGNCFAFFDKYLKGHIEQNTFYCAIRLEPITADTLIAIDSALEACLLELGITEDTLSNLPDLETLVHIVFLRLKENKSITEFTNYFEFYSKMLHSKQIRFEQGKKSVLTSKMNYHYWHRFLPFSLVDQGYLAEEQALLDAAIKQAKL